jgi:putative ABC transport system permease protein
VYGITIKEGRYFSTAGEAPNSIVINETAQKKLGVQVGDKLKFAFSPDIEHTVIGVVKDFHTESLHSQITPVVIEHIRDALIFRHYTIKLKPGDLSESVKEVERQWRKVFPDEAFQYAFGDDRIAMLYKTELQLNKAANMATILMLVIVMTGVLGLVALNIARRTKEIGIRKVLGASAQSILGLLSLEYVLIIFAAFLVAIPLSYWFARQWLNTFVDHIDLSPWMFGAPGIALLGITVLVVCIKGAATAQSNPVNSIRHE